MNTYEQHQRMLSDKSHAELYDYLNSLKCRDIRYLAEAIDEDIDYSLEKIDDTINFIFENLLIGINCQTFEDNTDKGVIGWCFDEIVKMRTRKIKTGMKWWNYWPCLISAMSYTCKDLNLLDNIDRFIRVTSSDYVDTYHLTDMADYFNIAFKVRQIDNRNMVEVKNKANNGWYGNPDKAKYKFELGIIENHIIPWVEDTGITEYYLRNHKDINKYADAHNWSDNKRTHTYKKVKNCYKADEKKKGINSLRLITLLKELKAFTPLCRADSDYIKFIEFKDAKFKKITSKSEPLE